MSSPKAAHPPPSSEDRATACETEFERYRIIQDRLFCSDFEKLLSDDGTLPILPFEE